MTGFGLMTSYHADNECCKLSDMAKGFRVSSESSPSSSEVSSVERAAQSD